MENTKRFSDRVENYVKYRPGYPDEMIGYLLEKGVGPDSILCDIGAGTGILSRQLVDMVGELYAVEPNDEMRRYAEESLTGYSNYHSIPSSAENTGLDDSSFDAVTVAQAFHWFDREKCKAEFRRILKPEGLVFLIWNNRINNTPFLEGYDELLYRLGTDYASVNHQNLTDDVIGRFMDRNYEKTVFDNFQNFDLEGFLGRVFSCSYTPNEDHPDYQIFHSELIDLFNRHQEEGSVRFNYRTEVYCGNMTKD